METGFCSRVCVGASWVRSGMVGVLQRAVASKVRELGPSWF